DKHRQIEAREGHRVERRPGGENGAAAQNQPDLIAFPDRADRVDDDAPLHIGLADHRHENVHTEIEPVHRGEGNQQYTEQYPPDDAQGFIVQQFAEYHDPYSAGAMLAGARIASGLLSGSGPALMARIIRPISMMKRTV